MRLTTYDSGEGYDSTTNTYFDVRDKSVMTFTFSDGGDEDVNLVYYSLFLLSKTGSFLILN